VFSPTRVYAETNIRSTALVGVFTNKSLCRNKHPQHRPCWCFHQQESMQKQTSLAPPLLVFSPTRVYAETNIRSTALVGVFTNKSL
jgi:hypothetical protein